MRDILEGLPRRIDCLDKGFVELIDVMPRLVEEGQTADYAIVQAARVSYGKSDKPPDAKGDRDLIRYMIRHDHGSPLEMVEFKFACKIPILTARQWIRHRICSYNEVSARYSEMKDEFFIPSSLRTQSKTNKQGSDAVDPKLSAHLESIEKQCDEAYSLYIKMIEDGVAKELARMVLPVNLYTEWYFKVNLRSLFNFLGLRCDSHAQEEIRVFADAILSLVSPIVPVAIEAWQDYSPKRGAVLLTRLEADAIRAKMAQIGGPCPPEIESANKREKDEAREKFLKLGFTI